MYNKSVYVPVHDVLYAGCERVSHTFDLLSQKASLKTRSTTSLLHHLTAAICALCVSGMTALVIFPFDWPSHNVISVAAV